MKKILYSAFLAAAVLLTACDKDDIENTNMVDLAGQWWVTVDATEVDGNDSYYYEDPYGLGRLMVLTYNTAADQDSIYVEDLGEFWDFKVRVAANTAAKTFGNDGFAENEAYPSGVEIKNGKVLFGAATTPHGTPADSIYFDVVFDDDDPGITYHISGFRYTGLEQDGLH